MPVPLAQVAVLVEKVGAMQLDSPQFSQHREIKARGRHLHPGPGPRARCRRPADHQRLRPAAPSAVAAQPGAGTRSGHPRRRHLGERAARAGGGRRSARRSRPSARSATACSPTWPASRSSSARARSPTTATQTRRARAGPRARARIRRAGRGPGGLVRAAMDFTSLTFADVSRHFGRRRALSGCRSAARRGDVRRCSAPTAPASRRFCRSARRCSCRRPAQVRYGEHRAVRPARRCGRASACSATTSTCIPS